MSLKLRYASFLLVVLCLLALFCSGSVLLIYRSSYVAAAGLLLLLYFTTYLLGKRFAGIFFTLSFLRLLRQKNGVFSRSAFELYMEKSIAARRNPEQTEALKHQILQVLKEEGLISIEDDTILLLKP